MKAKRDIQQEITDQIIAMMETSGADWVKPFAMLATSPMNPITGKKYRGLNAFWLGLMGIQYCAGYGQWKTIGAQVVKGGKGIGITKPMPIKDKDTGDIKMMLFGAATVFAASQVDGWTPPVVVGADETEVLAEVDAYVSSTGARVTQADAAFYVPSQDHIGMPPRGAFNATDTSSATETYYSTLLHELVHWTGHKSRCNRLDDKSKRGYAFEELVAEIGSVMLSVQLGVSPVVREDHAKYLSNWLQALKDDKSYIVDAAKLAQKAIDHLDGLQSTELRQAA